MEIKECFQYLEITESATDEEINRAYKRLALKYHPDKNPGRLEWANRAMVNLNIAYATIRGFRFTSSTSQNDSVQPEPGGDKHEKKRRPAKSSEFSDYKDDEQQREYLINQFVKYRESAKDGLYKYFQYGLNNLMRRENSINQGIFNRIVKMLRRSYHRIKGLSEMTDEPELLQHFSIFNNMIFNFYKASECLNFPETYTNLTDLEAFRKYKKGDDALHRSHKEIFYDRHNRGFLKKDTAEPLLLLAEYHLKEAAKDYPESSWAVEIRIKLEYVVALKKYLKLFFEEEN